MSKLPRRNLSEVSRSNYRVLCPYRRQILAICWGNDPSGGPLRQMGAPPRAREGPRKSCRTCRRSEEGSETRQSVPKARGSNLCLELEAFKERSLGRWAAEGRETESEVSMVRNPSGG